MPFCTNCGAQVKEGSQFCASCGTKIGTPIPPLGPSITPPSTQGESHRSAILALLLIGILAVGVWYGIGYGSARGLQIQQDKGLITYRSGLLGYAEFDVDVTVSNTGSFTSTISQVSFGLTIDSLIPLQSVQGNGYVLGPGQSVDYVLKFVTTDSADLQYISQGGTHQVSVSITAWVSSGIYSGWIIAYSSSSWSWSSS